MIATKLILIEGPPGSGKSTSARVLAEEISATGQACRFFYEWAEDHPIPIGDDLQLKQVISTALEREAAMLEMWKEFARARQAEEQVTIIESRFWQTSAMLMYIAGQPLEAVLESNRQVIEAVQSLNPVLIYFAVDDQKAFAERTIHIKNEEWRQAGLKEVWEQHLYDAFDGQKWFTQRGLSGRAGWQALLEEWAGVAAQLYDQAPFPKIKIRNPHNDWPLAMRQMRSFLDLGSTALPKS